VGFFTFSFHCVAPGEITRLISSLKFSRGNFSSGTVRFYSTFQAVPAWSMLGA
jgi:hypothetical protein